MTRPAVHFERLGNGLSLLIQETRLAPVAEVQVWANVGSADERPGEAGVAHFHEHMLFKGTERRGVGAVAGEVEGAGGRINAYTSFDVTVYHATLPAEALAIGMDVLSDMVLGSVFEPAEIEREIEVVLEEIRRSEDSPHSVLGDAVFAAAYREHPYRLPILGTPESVARFDRERVFDFYRRWYTPEQLCLVVVGDVHRDAVLEEARTRFGTRPRGAARRKRPAEPRQYELRCAVLERPFERVNVELVHPAVGLSSVDAPLLDLLAYVLGSGDSSRLARRVRERDGLVERIDASCYTPVEPGLFSVSFETDAARAGAALEGAAREVAQLRAEPVTRDELEKARANFLASEDFERESVSGLAYKLGSFQHLAGDFRHEERYFEALRAATPEALQRVASEYLAPETLTVGAVVPRDSEALDEPRIRAAVERAHEGVTRAYALPQRTGDDPEVISYALACGAQLHVSPRREVPVVAGRAAFLGGLLAEGRESAGIGAFLASMWLRGTRGRSAADFARATEEIAAEIDGWSARSSLGLTFETRSERLGRTLELFCEALLEPGFEPDEIERERRETLAAIERREDRLAQRCSLLFAETLMQRHPYRQPLFGYAESVERIDLAALEAHRARLVRGDNLSIAIAGDVDPDAVAASLSAKLSALESGPFEAPAPEPEPRPDTIRIAELQKDRAQTHIVLGFRGLTLDDPDRHTLDVVTQLLAGQGGRLFLELRDRRGLAYAVNAANVEGMAPGWFAVSIGTAPEKEEEARKGLLEELRRLVDEPPAEDELENARRHLAGGFAIDRQRNAVHAAQISLDALYGLGATASRSYPADIRAIGREDVLRVARRIIDLDAYTLATIRP